MSKKHNTKFYWDSEQKIARCILTSGDKKYTGMAFCHPTDTDMASEKVGYEIAYHRALISLLKDEKRKLKLELKGLNSLLYAINNSPRFNPKSYETKMLYRQIQMREDDIESVNELLRDVDGWVKNFIETKENFYQQIRKRRDSAQ